MIKEGEDLVKDFRGMNTLKDIFLHNVKENQSKPVLGTRVRTVQDGSSMKFGEYEWKTYS